MTKHFKSSSEARPLMDNFQELATKNRTMPSVADYWQDAVSKQNHFDHCRSAVEDLRIGLDHVCSEIVKHGSNAQRCYQARMLEVGLLHARRQLELASQQLDQAVVMLRRAHARQAKPMM